MRRHLLRPGTHREDSPQLVWARHQTCEHGGPAPCPWPGCHRGVVGDRLVIAGPREVKYFERDRTLDIQQGRLLMTWRWVEVRAVNLVELARSA